jgi:hypothetical protein
MRTRSAWAIGRKVTIRVAPLVVGGLAPEQGHLDITDYLRQCSFRIVCVTSAGGQLSSRVPGVPAERKDPM